ncbi:hypothetical protein PC118_g14754 [Phytophthora cactorum]|uniref:Uncharacterized protein n=1 Tax=Phytophthora cactorum TaxID=29920 RepID=A0A329RYD7_9STRA|nr:hypothetical protein PC112_g14139 [Phytophthora cactorum]KAG2852529.1 hypothetical protein PC113_g14942 [Phytophthora cactorum]KAG2898531.1 hypothetical protein PC115_g16821 [Phytophthora cactorum]KAG2913872.1 hypothetical protein PC117_g18486 [Phytophthora cactorum]KAG2974071.1 hypothetical protein PC118_g14754 [Phytophthora cactorum]
MLAQIWERLKKERRSKDARMRYELFLGGIGNKQMKTMLNSSMVTSIEEACALLLYKNLHLPVEEEDGF